MCFEIEPDLLEKDLISYEVQELEPLVIKECAIGTGKLDGSSWDDHDR